MAGAAVARPVREAVGEVGKPRVDEAPCVEGKTRVHLMAERRAGDSGRRKQWTLPGSLTDDGRREAVRCVAREVGSEEARACPVVLQQQGWSVEREQGTLQESRVPSLRSDPGLPSARGSTCGKDSGRRGDCMESTGRHCLCHSNILERCHLRPEPPLPPAHFARPKRLVETSHAIGGRRAVRVVRPDDVYRGG